MPDIHIRRDHQLGLPRARQVAHQWVDKAEHKLDMQCAVVEGDDGDTVEFSRSGITGEMRVTADRFELDAKLGFLMGAFAGKIESEIERHFDELLGSAPGKPSSA